MDPQVTGFERWRWRHRVELAAVFMILGVLVALFVARIPHYEAAVEETALHANIEAMRAGLAQAVLVARVHDNTKGLAALPGSNPVNLAAVPPGGYLGIRRGQNPGRVKPGHWYFDPTRGVLIYRVRSRWAFSSPLGPPPRVVLKIVVRRGGTPQLVSMAPFHFHP